MATRGSIYVAGKRYYISSDAHPSFAKKVIRGALKVSKTRRQFVLNANKMAGFRWIDTRVSTKGFRPPFEEYRYKVNIRKKSVSAIRPKYKLRR